MTKKSEQKLDDFYLRCMRRILKIMGQGRKTNVELRKRAGIGTFRKLMDSRRLHWFGHLSRISIDRLPKQALDYILAGKERRKGSSNVCQKQAKRCQRNVLDGMQQERKQRTECN